VTLRLAVLRDGVLRPYVDDPDTRRGWALSEVSVAKARVASCPAPKGLEAAVEAAKADWGRWERESPRVLLAVMHRMGNGFGIAGLTQDGDPIELHYELSMGVRWSGKREAESVERRCQSSRLDEHG